MRIFLTGATGFVGSAILPELHRAGHQVLALARSEQSANAVISAGAEMLRGDLRNPASLRKGVEATDAVIHAAFDHDFSRFAESCELDRQAIEVLGAELEGTDRKLIVTSGLPVIEGRAATEQDAPPAEAHGLPRVSEQTAMAFREKGVDVSVIRMPQVHDREKQGFASYLMAHAREAGVSAYVGTGENRWPAVHRLDAARLVQAYFTVVARFTSGGIDSLHCRQATIAPKWRFLVTILSRQIHLVSRPSGMPGPDNFKLVEGHLDPPGKGELLVKNHWLSVDPYMRGRMVDEDSYIPPFQLGEAMDGAAIGEVIESGDEKFAAGNMVSHFAGWRDHAVIDASSASKLDPAFPPQAYLGALGFPGLAAYVGLLKIGALREGDTVFVSAAAGTVGSLVAQIAKIKGCRVIGSIGSEEKERWLREELGVDALVNYKQAGSLTDALAAAAPARGAGFHRGVKLRQGQITLVIGPRKPLRGDTADPLSARDIDFVAAARVAPAVQGFKVGHGLFSATGRSGASLSTSKPVTAKATELLL